MVYFGFEHCISQVATEKANLAAFTGEEPIMVPRHFISTNGTEFLKIFIIGVIHHFKLRH